MNNPGLKLGAKHKEKKQTGEKQVILAGFLWARVLFCCFWRQNVCFFARMRNGTAFVPTGIAKLMYHKKGKNHDYYQMA